MTNYNIDHLPKLQRGETFQWSFDGDVDTGGVLLGTLTAELKATFDGRPPNDSIAADLVLDVSTTTDTGEGEKGFIITANASDTLTLNPNRYIVIAKYVVSADVAEEIVIVDDFVLEFGQ